jgi:hypothetical protein
MTRWRLAAGKRDVNVNAEFLWRFFSGSGVERSAAFEIFASLVRLQIVTFHSKISAPPPLAPYPPQLPLQHLPPRASLSLHTQ